MATLWVKCRCRNRKTHDHGQHEHDRARHQQAVVGLVLAAREDRQRDRQRVVLSLVSATSGHRKVFHAGRNVKIAERGQRRGRQRQHDAPEDAPLARAVDAGRLEQVVGDRRA